MPKKASTQPKFKGNNSTLPPAPRNPDGTWVKGFSGRAGIDLGRARRDLNHATISAMREAFDEGGREAIYKVMTSHPAIFLKMLVLLVPRELEVTHTGGVKAMTDEQIESAISVIEEMLAKRAQSQGDSAKVIEAVAEKPSENTS